MLVKIDAREKDRIQSATKYFQDELKLDVTVEELEIGDYVFTDGKESVVFEFKLISDFIASIQTNRVFNQAISQAETYDYHFVVIHGDEHTRNKCIAMTRNFKKITVFQYLAAISSINRYSTVIESYGAFLNESYYRMYIQAKKCLQKRPIVKKFPKKHKNPALNFLTYCIYGLNFKRANEIVTQLELNTLEDLLYLDHQKLISIDGIGPKLADRILQSISDDTYD